MVSLDSTLLLVLILKNYVNQILENVFYNIAVLHVAADDLLQESSLASIKNLLLNLTRADKKYQVFNLLYSY